MDAGQKVFYVTGCDSGFGAMVVRALDTQGYNCFAGCYTEAGQAALKEACSSRVVPIALDVTSETSVAEAGAAVAAQLLALGDPDKGLDGVLNNAGILVTPGPTEWTTPASFDKMYRVNVLGTAMVTNSVLPLIRRARGRVVNVASIAGRVGLPSQPAYCASKYAVEGLSDVLRRDMAPWGVTVHIVEPGVFHTTGLYDTYQTGFDKLWETLPGSLKEEYGEEFRSDFRARLGKALVGLGNTDNSIVVTAYLHALTADKPKYRYRAGKDSKYLFTFVSWLPEVLQDRLLGSTSASLPAAVGGVRATGQYASQLPSILAPAAILALAVRGLVAIVGGMRGRARM